VLLRVECILVLLFSCLFSTGATHVFPLFIQ
jgi:hypothetical protein